MQKFLLHGTMVPLSVTRALGFTMWQQTVWLEEPDAWKGQTEHGNSAANDGVFDVIKLGTFHLSVREMLKERRHQRQSSSQASEKPAIACCKSACPRTRMHSSGGFWMLTDTGEQSCGLTVETEGGGSANV